MAREHAFATTLAPLGLPVPRAVGPVCEDETVLGTPFWVYEYVTGRHFADPYLKKASLADRPELFKASIRSLASIHAACVSFWSVYIKRRVPEALREAYGGEAKHHGGYLCRQVRTWTRQYESATEQLGRTVSL